MSETLLEKISNAAKERFQNIAFPTRKDEYWRFADLDTWSVDTLFPYFTGRPPEEGPIVSASDVASATPVSV